MANRREILRKARKIIENARNKGLAKLDLSGVGLIDKHLATLLPELSSLTALKYLHLRVNRLKALPPGVGSLKALVTLGLAGNSLTTLPAELGSLKKLTTLDLSGNRLTELPPEIGSLEKLRQLSVRGNQLTTLPDSLKALKESLKKLFAFRNAMNTPPAVIASLTSLETLDLGQTSLTNAASVVELLETLPNLKEIHLNGNALRWAGADSDISPEALQEQDPKKLLKILLERKPMQLTPCGGEIILTQTTETVDWIRATVLGKQEVGKSLLFTRLLDKPIKELPKKTQAFESATIRMEGVGPHNRTIFTRCFDLGGDPDLHGAHSTFLRDQRNVYLILCNGSESRDKSLLDYWLKVVRAYGSYFDLVEDQPALEVSPPATVVVSWRDKRVHAEFEPGVFSAEKLAHNHSRLNLQIVRDYWDPWGGRDVEGMNHGERLEAVRDSLRAMIREQHRELNAGYPLGYRAAIADFDHLDEDGNEKESLFDSGPMTITEVRQVFEKHTKNRRELERNEGLDLLRNMGLAICPTRDAEQKRNRLKYARENIGRDEDSYMIPPADEVTNLWELKNHVFGVEWLKKPIYHIVRIGTFEQKTGVVSYEVLIEQLMSQGMDELTAKLIFELMKWQRLIFQYRNSETNEWLIVDRLKPVDVANDEDQKMCEGDDDFGTLWSLKLDLLMESHLPQFIGQSYSLLRRESILGPDAKLREDARRNRIVVKWGQNPKVEALLTVNLNQAQVHARMRGGTEGEQIKFLRQIEHQFLEISGERRKEFEPQESTSQQAKDLMPIKKEKGKSQPEQRPPIPAVEYPISLRRPMISRVEFQQVAEVSKSQKDALRHKVARFVRDNKGNNDLVGKWKNRKPQHIKIRTMEMQRMFEEVKAAKKSSTNRPNTSEDPKS